MPPLRGRRSKTEESKRAGTKNRAKRPTKSAEDIYGGRDRAQKAEREKGGNRIGQGLKTAKKSERGIRKEVTNTIDVDDQTETIDAMAMAILVFVVSDPTTAGVVYTRNRGIIERERGG